MSSIGAAFETLHSPWAAPLDRGTHAGDTVRMVMACAERALPGVVIGRHQYVRRAHRGLDGMRDIEPHALEAKLARKPLELLAGHETRIQKRGGEHVASDSSDAFEKQGPAHSDSRRAPSRRASRTRWATLQAAYAAEKPLSMLATVTPGAHELSIASNAASPPKLAP